MTEEEAKTRWCPQTRVTADVDAWHTNRPSHADCADKHFDRCIGSACMAWRWGAAFGEARQGAGFCGLAGAPQ